MHQKQLLQNLIVTLPFKESLFNITHIINSLNEIDQGVKNCYMLQIHNSATISKINYAN